jgi:hypothetical protein
MHSFINVFFDFYYLRWPACCIIRSYKENIHLTIARIPDGSLASFLYVLLAREVPSFANNKQQILRQLLYWTIIAMYIQLPEKYVLHFNVHS